MSAQTRHLDPIRLALAASMLVLWGTDADAGTTERVSVDSNGVQGNNESQPAAISADGRFVAFESDATNLVPGDTNSIRDVFVHDRETGVTEAGPMSAGRRSPTR